MNELSWLIYAADVANKINVIFILFFVVSIILVPTVSFLFSMAAEKGSMPEGSWKRPWRFMWLPTVCLFVLILIPSSNTIYMIAASQVGERVVTSPDAVEIMGDLKAVIKKKLKEELETQ